MRLFYSSAFFCVIFLLISCAYTKEEYIDDYTNFIEEVSEKSVLYSSEQWRNADSINAVYSSDYYEAYSYEMTDNEKAIVRRLKGKYSMLKILDTSYDIKEEIEQKVLPVIKDVINQIEGATEVILEKETRKDSLRRVKELRKDSFKRIKKE